MFSRLWNAVVDFFRSATLRGMQLGAEDFAKQFEAEARELSGQPPVELLPVEQPTKPLAAKPAAIQTAAPQAAITQAAITVAVIPAPKQITAAPKPQVLPEKKPESLDQRIKQPPPANPAPPPPASDDGYTVPVKRGRGRPRKNPEEGGK